MATVYEFLQQEKNSRELMPKDAYHETMTNVGAWFSSDMKHKYYMLLNNELHDYTVLNFIQYNFNQGVEELEKVLKRCGPVIDIEYNHEQHYFEFWVRSNYDEGYPHMYILFPCDDFIVEVR